MLVYLRITTYIGISIGAMHYYGDLIFYGADREDVTLKHKLNARQVREMRKRGYDYINVGTMYHGFETKDEIIELAKKIYKEHFPQATMLLLGNPAYSEPKKVLDAPADIIANIGNRLYDMAKELGEERWADHPDEMEKICARWDDFIKLALKEQ